MKLQLPLSVKALLVSMRPLQWTKNLSVFAALIISGYLFEVDVLIKVIAAFFSLSLVSSASYILNDLVDAPLDRKHPKKKERPIAKGLITYQVAVIDLLVLFFIGFGIASLVNFGFSLLVTAFFLLHISYTFVLKRRAVWDILAISSAFILRALGGEIASGYHLPVWLTFTVVFLSLFLASGKRRSEAVSQGDSSRPTLKQYKVKLLDFYLSIFAVSTLVSYSLFTYFAGPQAFATHYLQALFGFQSYLLLDRKWLMITIFPVIFGIMKYAQIVFFGRNEGERPEKLLVTHPSLLGTVFAWGLMLILIIYG
jgi:4-hydroxybenzoate polyprenyltransferase